MSSERLPVIICGCGGMSGLWIRITLSLPELELVGLVDIRRQAALERARQFNLPESLVFTDLKTAIRRTGARIVFDVTVPQAHHQVTLTALRLGCHVLGEKPMSDRLDRARRMVQAARRTGLIYAVAQTRRPDPGAVAVTRFIQSGQLGQIAEVHSDFFLGPHFGGFREQMPDVLLVDMAIHTFDNARQFTGADPLSVWCRSWNPPHSWYKGHASALAVFDLQDPSGHRILYTYRGSWCAQGANTSWNASWRIIGSRGTLIWDGQNDLRFERPDPDSPPALVPRTLSQTIPPADLPAKAHEAIIRNFLEAIRSGRTDNLWSPCTDNIKSLAMVLAAVRSAHTGKKVPVRW